MDKGAAIAPRGALLVTGASGKTGRAFYRELTERGYDRAGDIIFATRRASRLGFVKVHAVEEIDINDISQVRELLSRRRVTEILHIAGVGRSDVIVEAAVEAGVKRVILVHTTGIYSRHKQAGELYRAIERRIADLTEGRGISVVILRPTMIFGPGDSNMSVFVKMARRLSIFPLISGGKARLQPVWCEDLGKAYYQALTHELREREYILSGADAMTFREMIDAIGRSIGVKHRFVSIPYWAAYSAAWSAYIITMGHVDYRERVQRLAEDRHFPHAAATRDFGYSPTPFAEAINRYCADCCKTRPLK